MKKHHKVEITRDFLARLNFRVMTPQDRLGFAGCESPIPLIAETDDGKYLVAVDGDFCEVYGDDDDGSFTQVAVCGNIRALPIPSY